MSIKLRTDFEEMREMNRIERRRKGEACRVVHLYKYGFDGVRLFVCSLVRFVSFVAI